MRKAERRVTIRVSEGAHDKLLGLVFRARKQKATIISVLDELLKVK